MNRTCNGDVFARWGETWARCFLDSALFQIAAPIETCPNCGRPWEGREIQRDGRQLLWDPDKDPRVMVADRDRRIAALESALAAERATIDRLKEKLTARTDNLRAAERERDKEAANGAALRTALEARVQALVEAARKFIKASSFAEWTIRATPGIVSEWNESVAEMRAAIDAFAGHAPTGENR